MESGWNPWHGCHKKSEGCKNCYVYGIDTRYEKDASVVIKNKNFYSPIQKNKKGDYKIKSKSLIYTCFSSDFLLEDADDWRKEAWDIIRERNDCKFLFITKRIERFQKCIPIDWKDGWEHVIIACTCENQKRADERLPIFLKSPIKHKIIVCEPLLENIDLSKYLTKDIEQVVAGGESGLEARLCDYNWVLSIREQCIKANIKFIFKQTGRKFLKNNKLYFIRKKDQGPQARKAKINYYYQK